MANDHIKSLREKAEAVLLDKKNWANEQGWVSRHTFGVLFMPNIDVTIACRAREADLKYSQLENEEPLYVKIDLGRRRVCRRVESGLHKEYNEDKTLIRLISSKFVRRKKKPSNGPRFSVRQEVTIEGEKRTVGEWSKRLNISVGTVMKRLRDGWSFEEVFTTPVAAKLLPTITVHGVVYDLISVIPTEWSTVQEVMNLLKPHVKYGELVKSYQKREECVKKYQMKKKGKTPTAVTPSEELIMDRGLRYFTHDVLSSFKNKKMVQSAEGKFRRISTPEKSELPPQ